MLAFSLLVSFSFTFGHMVANDITPAALNAIRFAIAAVVLVLISRALGVSIRPAFTRSWRFAVIGALMATYFITMFEALRVTTPVATAAVFTLTPLLAAGAGRIMAGQRSGRWTVSALIIGGCGALWVIFRADLQALLRFQIGRGELLFMIGALAHSVVPALSRRWAKDDLPLQTSLGIITGAFIVTAIYGFRDLVALDLTALRPSVWLVILYLATIATAVTFFLLQFASQRIPAGKVMAYTYLVPSWVVLWEFLLHGTAFPLALLAGVVATQVALLMLLRGEAT